MSAPSSVFDLAYSAASFDSILVVFTASFWLPRMTASPSAAPADAAFTPSAAMMAAPAAAPLSRARRDVLRLLLAMRTPLEGSTERVRTDHSLARARRAVL